MRTGNMFSIATITPVRASRTGSSSSSQRRYARCHRNGGCITTTGTWARSATWIARSILPIGSVPHTFLVTSNDGAWIAPIVRPCSSARARMRAGSWLAGSFVTMTSTPVNPVSVTMRNVLASGLAKKAADEKSNPDALTPPW